MLSVNLLHFYCFFTHREGGLIKESEAHVFVWLFWFLFLLFLFLFRWKQDGERHQSILRRQMSAWVFSSTDIKHLCFRTAKCDQRLIWKSLIVFALLSKCNNMWACRVERQSYWKQPFVGLRKERGVYTYQQQAQPQLQRPQQQRQGPPQHRLLVRRLTSRGLWMKERNTIFSHLPCTISWNIQCMSTERLLPEFMTSLMSFPFSSLMTCRETEALTSATQHLNRKKENQKNSCYCIILHTNIVYLI